MAELSDILKPVKCGPELVNFPSCTPASSDSQVGVSWLHVVESYKLYPQAIWRL